MARRGVSRIVNGFNAVDKSFKPKPPELSVFFLSNKPCKPLVAGAGVALFLGAVVFCVADAVLVAAT